MPTAPSSSTWRSSTTGSDGIRCSGTSVPLLSNVNTSRSEQTNLSVYGTGASPDHQIGRLDGGQDQRAEHLPYTRSAVVTRTCRITSPSGGASPSGSEGQHARRCASRTPISGSRRRSTVMREREQPLQTTSNTRLNSSGKSSPFSAHRLDVPVHLLAEIGKAPPDGTGWHQAFRQA